MKFALCQFLSNHLKTFSRQAIRFCPMTRTLKFFPSCRKGLAVFCLFLMFFHLDNTIFRIFKFLFDEGYRILARMTKILILTRSNPRQNENMACLHLLKIVKHNFFCIFNKSIFLNILILKHL
jgi:hypothetical protein